MFWAPAIVAALLVVLVGGTMLYGLIAHGAPNIMHVDGHSMSYGAFASAMPLQSRHMIARAASGMYLAAGAPLFFILVATVFFYCLGAMYDERRDRSILFWKSLPVSDGMTVLSKAVTALCVAPLITMALATVTSLAMLLIGAIGMALAGINLGGALLVSPDLYLQPLRLLGLLPVYVVWALPTVGWLLLCSSFARSKPFLWAVALPIMAGVLNSWFGLLKTMTLTSTWFWQNIVGRLLLSIIPGSWMDADTLRNTFERAGEDVRIEMGPRLDGGFTLDAIGHALASPSMLIGIVAGAAMIAAAVYFRRVRTESYA
jgi:ABC-2 type transport system permease protein